MDYETLNEKRICKFIFKKNYYENIKEIRNNNYDNIPINLLEIIDFSVDRKYDDKFNDYYFWTIENIY